MSKKAVFTKEAPAPLPVYSQGIISSGETVYCSGQVPFDPKTGVFVEGDFKERVRQCIRNLEAVLKAAGSSLDDVIKVNAYLGDIAKFGEFNEVYVDYFGDIKPARTCFEVGKLPANADVEIECIAVKK